MSTEKQKEYLKKYRELNREKIKNSAKIYRDRNKEKTKQYNENYFKNLDKDKIKEYNKKSYKKNKDKLLCDMKEYYLNNKEYIKERNKKYIKNRRNSDHLFKLKTNISKRINKALTTNGYTKRSRTHEILGCAFAEFKTHIESKWEPWMSWDNYGLYNGELNYGWDIDHIVPVSSAKTEEELIKLNHYTNLRPLCSKINRDIKRDWVN